MTKNMDQSAVNRLIKRDNGEWRRLDKRYRNSIMNVITKISPSVTLSEDCYNALMLELPDKLISYDVNRNFLPWIKSVARNFAIDFFKEERKWIKMAVLIGISYDERYSYLGINPERIYLAKEFEEICINLLNENHHDEDIGALIYYGIHDYEIETIANLFNCSKGAVHAKICRGRKKFTEAFQKAYPRYREDSLYG
jgi:RNA polymerase sigma factor (sigma-70 family)